MPYFTLGLACTDSEIHSVLTVTSSADCDIFEIVMSLTSSGEDCSDESDGMTIVTAFSLLILPPLSGFWAFSTYLAISARENGSTSCVSDCTMLLE